MHTLWTTFQLSSLMSSIPVVATVVTSALSILMARATLRYAEAADKSLALAREEFEREWAPELHLRLERLSATESRIMVTNLAKISVLLQLVQVRKLTHLVPFERVLLNEPLVGGTTWTQNFRKQLLIATGDEFEGPIAASATFYASGRMYRTDWFRFQIAVRNGTIQRLEPINIAARRVQVLAPDGEPPAERELELVRDVTAALSDETTVDSEA
jgi:hypothetical protein